ncbi:DnaJ-like protein MG200 [Carpediemonas membranifera]|uniref:DnaJ-like protein MG200 n=1 Tax=Carpediemonas membranifera TaxID=201153 RepID=A0A8J6ATI7_9EUKA|nr:DnaJ-like protein MG200 [Carpediemonas membranifera]|eukprot:KAG9391110.1 DnaJ-like protein MG200 [Carpediemonas membranifera]
MAKLRTAYRTTAAPEHTVPVKRRVKVKDATKVKKSKPKVSKKKRTETTKKAEASQYEEHMHLPSPRAEVQTMYNAPRPVLPSTKMPQVAPEPQMHEPAPSPRIMHAHAKQAEILRTLRPDQDATRSRLLSLLRRQMGVNESTSTMNLDKVTRSIGPSRRSVKSYLESEDSAAGSVGRPSSVSIDWAFRRPEPSLESRQPLPSESARFSDFSYKPESDADRWVESAAERREHETHEPAERTSYQPVDRDAYQPTERKEYQLADSRARPTVPGLGSQAMVDSPEVDREQQAERISPVKAKSVTVGELGWALPKPESPLDSTLDSVLDELTSPETPAVRHALAESTTAPEPVAETESPAKPQAEEPGSPLDSTLGSLVESPISRQPLPSESARFSDFSYKPESDADRWVESAAERREHETHEPAERTSYQPVDRDAYQPTERKEYQLADSRARPTVPGLGSQAMVDSPEVDREQQAERISPVKAKSVTVGELGWALPKPESPLDSTLDSVLDELTSPETPAVRHALAESTTAPEPVAETESPAKPQAEEPGSPLDSTLGSLVESPISRQPLPSESARFSDFSYKPESDADRWVESAAERREHETHEPAERTSYQPVDRDAYQPTERKEYQLADSRARPTVPGLGSQAMVDSPEVDREQQAERISPVKAKSVTVGELGWALPKPESPLDSTLDSVLDELTSPETPAVRHALAESTTAPEPVAETESPAETGEQPDFAASPKPADTRTRPTIPDIGSVPSENLTKSMDDALEFIARARAEKQMAKQAKLSASTSPSRSPPSPKSVEAAEAKVMSPRKVVSATPDWASRQSNLITSFDSAVDATFAHIPEDEDDLAYAVTVMDQPERVSECHWDLILEFCDQIYGGGPDLAIPHERECYREKGRRALAPQRVADLAGVLKSRFKKLVSGLTAEDAVEAQLMVRLNEQSAARVWAPDKVGRLIIGEAGDELLEELLLDAVDDMFG